MKTTLLIHGKSKSNLKLYVKQFLVLVFAVAINLNGVQAQTKSIVKSSKIAEGVPESAGMSSDRLSRIDSMCDGAIKKGQIPGAVTLVVRNGKIIHWKAFGMADNKAGKVMERDAIFRIASQTKAITSTAVMMLWEEGKFRLDDPISKYIPGFKNPRVLETFQYKDTTYTARPAKSEITIRHLLTHTAGIGYGMIDGDERMKMIFEKAGAVVSFTTEDITLRESMKILAGLPLHHDPGEKFTYSASTDVLGYLIEVLSGMPLDAFLKARIFDPLGMNDTRFYQPNENAGRLVAVQYKNQKDEWEKFPASFLDTDFPIQGAKRFLSGGSGLSGTAKDYAIFLQMYLNGGEYNGVRLLSRTTVKIIMANQIGDIWGEKGDSFHGLAFSVLTPFGEAKGGNGSAGTFSWGGYFNTQYFADPVERTIGIIMKQTHGVTSDHTGWKFPQLVNQAIDD